MAEQPVRHSELPEAISAHLRSPFDSALAHPTRLRIQAALHGLDREGSIRFTALAKALVLSDGNLATHLAVLGEVGYVTSHATRTGKRRTRWYSATAAGRDAFEAHVQALQLVVESSRASRRGSSTRHPID